jgi:hypothetical protein
LTGLEYLLKNGPPRVEQDLRSDIFRISKFKNFSYYEEQADKGHSIREKAKLIGDLLQSSERLQEERDQARCYREKFY